MADGRILPLPVPVSDQIKSCIAITSLNSTIVELVKNSLDGESKTIHISLDYSNGACIVQDDGSGIHPTEFSASSGLGKWYHTSKYPPNDFVHGFHGTFLASLGACSLLSIISRHKDYGKSNSLIVHSSQVVNRCTPVPDSHGTSLRDPGTRVIVRNLFGDVPVRVKQRTLLQNNHLEKERLLEDLKLELVALIFAWRGPLKITLLDSESSKSTCFKSNKHDSLQNKMSSLFKDAKFIASQNHLNWTATAASSDELKIKGIISLSAFPTKRYQYITAGVFLLKTTSHSSIFDAVNRLFKSSLYGLQESDTPLVSTSTKSYPKTVSLNSSMKSKRNVDKWPAFAFKIKFKKQIDTHIESVIQDETVISRITQIIEALVTEWLETYNFQISKSQNVSNGSLSAPRMKQSFTQANRQSNPTVDISSQSTAIGISNSKLREQHSDEPVIEPKINALNFHSLSPQSDPLNVKVIPGSHTTGIVDTTKASSNGNNSLQRPVRLTLRSRKPLQKQTSAWLQSINDKWTDPIFMRNEIPIQNVSNPITNQESLAVFDKKELQKIHSFQNQNILDCDIRLTKQSLLSSKVIAQVDKQFILLSMNVCDNQSQNHNVLVAVDQHAADERCRVEELLNDLCEVPQPNTFLVKSNIGLTSSVKHVKLPKPLNFELSSSEEIDHFQNKGQFFARWGILYDLFSEKMQLGILTLPAVIAERCMAEPSLLITVLREELWRYIDDSSSVVSDFTHDDDAQSWLRRVGHCPKGILDLINSRACRSAIMFNDKLTAVECDELIARLSKCHFPFQCAHGRRSMMPLVKLLVPNVLPDYTDHSPFVDAYKSWRLREDNL